MSTPRTLDELTAPEVAQILQVSKNTVYRLAKEGLLPSYSVGRKLRFSLADVESYIERSKNGEPAARARRTAASPVAASQSPVNKTGATPVIAGQDLMLDILANYLSTTGIKTLRSYQNSYDALCDLYKGEAQAAAVHLWDGSTDSYNLPYVKRLCPGTPVVVYHLATTTQGLLVPRDNLHDLRGWLDLVTKDVRIVNREPGCGSRVLLDEKLRMLEASPHALAGYDHEVGSALAVGSIVSRGGADAGIANERTFLHFDDLDYLPLQTEEIALVIRRGPLTVPLIKSVRTLLKSELFRREIQALGTYDLSRMGTELYEA